jgi:hypothetical protein
MPIQSGSPQDDATVVRTLTIPTVDIARLVVERVLRELERPTQEPGQLIPLTLTRGDSA